MKIQRVDIIGHFGVPLFLCFKASLSAKPFLWKWLWFAWEWNCMQNSFWNRQNRTRKWPIGAQVNRSFARSSHIVRNKLCWGVSYIVEPFNTKESRAGLVRVRLFWKLASQHNLFRIMCAHRAEGLSPGFTNFL